MVGDLLEVSRLRMGTVSLVPELNTAEDLVGAALRQVEGIRNGRVIETRIDFDAPAMAGRFDFVHTLRILGNLLDTRCATHWMRSEWKCGWTVMSNGCRSRWPTGEAASPSPKGRASSTCSIVRRTRRRTRAMRGWESRSHAHWRRCRVDRSPFHRHSRTRRG